jgi:hypothetical protein
MVKEDNFVLSQDEVVLLVNWAGKPIHFITNDGHRVCNYCTSPTGDHSKTCKVPALKALLEKIQIAKPRTYSIVDVSSTEDLSGKSEASKLSFGEQLALILLRNYPLISDEVLMQRIREIQGKLRELGV